MTYAKDETSHDYHEELRQIIPVKGRHAAAKHKVLIGFQATQAQLDFNRAAIKAQQEQEEAIRRAAAKAAQNAATNTPAPVKQ